MRLAVAIGMLLTSVVHNDLSIQAHSPWAPDRELGGKVAKRGEGGWHGVGGRGAPLLTMIIMTVRQGIE